MTRRAVVTTAAALPLSAPLSVGLAAAEDAVADLIKVAEEKNAAFMRGDMDRWAKITRIAPASHGFDASPKRLAELAQYFRNGRTKLQVAQTYRSERLVVLVMIEQQQAEVGGLPEQDWSLRVTEVYRKEGSEWQLAHRHADPLVHRITLEQAAALARG
jgi:ketosteroid isomerase-like protein